MVDLNKKQTFKVEPKGDKFLIEAEDGEAGVYSSPMSLGRFIFKKFKLDPNISTGKQL